MNASTTEKIVTSVATDNDVQMRSRTDREVIALSYHLVVQLVTGNLKYRAFENDAKTTATIGTYKNASTQIVHNTMSFLFNVDLACPAI